MKSKTKIIFVYLPLLVILGTLVGTFLYVNFSSIELMSSTSPDGKYKIVIFEKKKWFSMPGNGSSRCVKVELSKGFWRMDKNCNDCPTFSSELSTIQWDMKAMQVYYAPARSVNLVTGACEE